MYGLYRHSAKPLAVCVFLIFLAGAAYGGSITSSANGKWSDTTTWVGHVVPTSSDSVTIAAGDTVTVDQQVNILGLGIYGTLQFEDTLAWQMYPAGDLSIKSTGTLRPAATANNYAINWIFLNGNLVVDGTFIGRMPSGSQRGIAFSMCKGNSHISGSAGTIDFTAYLEIDVSGSSVILDRSVDVTGNLYLLHGTLDNSGHNVTVNAGAAIWRWYADGVVAAAPNFSGTDQTVHYWASLTTGPELPDILGNLRIENGSNVVLNKTVDAQQLSLTSGAKLITGSDTVIVDFTISAGYNESTYVRGNLGWKYTAPATRVYPVGSASAYRPVTLNVTALSFSSGTSGIITVSQTDTAPAKSSLPSGVNTISRIRYFTLSRSSNISSETSDVTLAWGADDGVSNPSTLTVVHGDASTGVWDRADSSGGRTGSASGGTVTGRGFTAAGNYVLGTTAGDNPLAVEVASFTAGTVTGGVALAWQTLSETNSLGFYVERRMNGVPAWTTVSPLIPGAGTSSDEHSYGWTDPVPASGTYFYRLREVALAGDLTYTQEIQVNFTSALGVGGPGGPKTFALGQNYPNPFNPSTVISYQLPVECAVTLKVYSVLGELVGTLLGGVRPAGYGSVEFDAHSLASGVYFYRLEAAGRADPARNFVEVRRMLIVR